MPLLPKFRRSNAVAVIELHGSIGTRVRETMFAKLLADVAS